MTTYEKLKKDFSRWMKYDSNSNVRFTSMIDLYALPKDFPNYNKSTIINNPFQKVEYLEDEFARDIQDSRFIPYIQLHEYEALILSKPQSLKNIFLEHDAQINALVELTKSFSSPELIDEGFDTSPSKRIIQQIPSYRYVKSIAGPSTAKDIGLNIIRKHCPHFGNWLNQLEKLNERFDTVNI